MNDLTRKCARLVAETSCTYRQAYDALIEARYDIDKAAPKEYTSEFLAM